MGLRAISRHGNLVVCVGTALDRPRMTPTRKKPGVAFWATVVVVVVLVAYPLRFGPACWWFASEKSVLVYVGPPRTAPMYAPRMYWPIGWLAANGPSPVGDAIFWCATHRHTLIMLPTEHSRIQ